MIRDKNNRITTDIYRKATYTDQYLQWTSNHPIHKKLRIVRTLIHHAETLVNDEGSMKTEKEKVRLDLRNCGHPEWALKKGEQLGKRQKRREEDLKGQCVKDRPEEPQKDIVVLPYEGGH